MHKDEVRKYVIEHLDKLSKKAEEALKGRRIVKLQTSNKHLYFFVGKQRDYIVFPGIYCSCKDFEISVMFREAKGACYHLIVAERAVKEGAVRTLNVSSDTFWDIFYEVMLNGKSLTLRRLLKG